MYEIALLGNFAGLKLGKPIPDETAILNFRRMAEDILKQVNALLPSKGLLLKRGSIVDATIIAAPARRRIPRASATRRCTRRRRATSGASG